MIKGSIVALVTPFTKDNKVNYSKLFELVDYQINNGSDGILLFGTTGEGSTLTKNEKVEIAKRSIEYVKNRIPLILNAGSNSTQEAIELVEELSSLHPYALLVINPYYNKGNDEGIFKHYQELNKVSEVPIIIYNVPSRTGKDLSISLIKRIMTLDKIIGIKEASSDINKLIELSKIQNERFYWYSGNDYRVIEDIKLGSKGLIGVMTNSHPKLIKEMIDCTFIEDYEKAYDIFFKLENYIKSLSLEVNPIPIKEALNILGHDVGNFRLPLYNLENEKREILIDALKEIEE